MRLFTASIFLPLTAEILIFLQKKKSDKEKKIFVFYEIIINCKNKYSIWGWIPELLKTDNPQDLYKLLPNELKHNDRILGEILMLNSDIPFSKGLITDNYVYASLENITNDNLCIWALHLSVSLNKLLHNWSFDSASTINLSLQNKYLKEYYNISKKYITLLEKTECDNLLPDVNFLHDFCAFTQNNDHIYLEQIEKHLPSENFKEVYALMKINMMSVLKLNKEAIEYIKNDWYELNTRDIEHCINLGKDIRIDLLNLC